MTDLILSEITWMGEGHCVIGLEALGDRYRSVRPMPPTGNAWPAPFGYQRGDVLQFRLARIPVTAPHVEDRRSTGILAKVRNLPEEELVDCLRRSEFGGELDGLFGCAVRESPRGGASACVEPTEAVRSICGCAFDNIRFRVFLEQVRAELTLASGETLRSLPIVDRDWNELFDWLRSTAGEELLKKLLNSTVRDYLLFHSNRLARIGLSRPFQGPCWLMLDSLFPGPGQHWEDNLPRNQRSEL